jgi:hypothetical protein
MSGRRLYLENVIETVYISCMSKGKLSYLWSRNLAYAIGLLVTDGSLSIDRRHIDISSVDKEQLDNFLLCLGKIYEIGTKKSGNGDMCFRIQFSDVLFYKFLLSIGLTPHKSKTIGAVIIPKKYFFDFLRGHFDGDGTFYSYKDPRWKSSYMFYLCFISASEKHIRWIQNELILRLGITGSLVKSQNSSVYQLKYAKKESLVLLGKLYYNSDVVCLARKREKIVKILKEQQTKYMRGCCNGSQASLRC